MWASGTHGHSGAYAVLGRNGELTVYASDGSTALWSTPVGSTGAYLAVQGDGNLVIYRQASTASQDALWSTGTWGHSGAYAIMQDDGNLVVYPRGGGPSSHDALWASNTWNAAR